MLRNDDNNFDDVNLNNEDELELELKPLPLIRQLSASYIDPDTGMPTNNDPNAYTGEEKIKREDALMKDAPHAGYVKGIKEERAKALILSITQLNCRAAFFNYHKKPDDDAPAALSFRIPVY